MIIKKAILVYPASIEPMFEKSQFGEFGPIMQETSFELCPNFKKVFVS